MRLTLEAHPSGKRLAGVILEAESFAEEKFLSALVIMVESHGAVEFTNGDNPIRGKFLRNLAIENESTFFFGEPPDESEVGC
ncbi:MAG: hypothetical protein KF752_11780 [Pirellulaceae bacterium]|nr:hypothetical protein [Pirellulaceae bacterium]